MHLIMKKKDELLWFRKLVKDSGEPFKTVRTHLKHLEKIGIVEYVTENPRRGGKRLFRLSRDHRWRRRMELEWCQRIHNLVQEALTYLGDGSFEIQLAQIDLGLDLHRFRARLPIKGRLILEYRSDAHPHNLLQIDWQHINLRRAKFTAQVLPGRELSHTELEARAS
jgi:DNA-binding transcriptional ArsR family regulator